MNDDKPYCKHQESDAAFAIAFTMVWGAITLILGIIGIISLF